MTLTLAASGPLGHKVEFDMEGSDLTVTFRQQFDPLALQIRLGKRKGRWNLSPTAFIKSWLPTLDNLRNFLLTPTTEALSFLQELR